MFKSEKDVFYLFYFQYVISIEEVLYYYLHFRNMPADTQCKNNVIMTSKLRRFDHIIMLLLRCMPAGICHSQLSCPRVTDLIMQWWQQTHASSLPAYFISPSKIQTIIIQIMTTQIRPDGTVIYDITGFLVILKMQNLLINGLIQMKCHTKIQLSTSIVLNITNLHNISLN